MCLYDYSFTDICFGTYTHIHIYIHIHTPTHTYVYLYTHMSKYGMHMCIYSCCSCVQRCVYIYICVYMYMIYLYTCVHMCIYICTLYSFVFMCIYTYGPKPSVLLILPAGACTSARRPSPARSRFPYSWRGEAGPAALALERGFQSQFRYC